MVFPVLVLSTAETKKLVAAAYLWNIVLVAPSLGAAPHASIQHATS
jgi:hypothetical protein